MRRTRSGLASLAIGCAVATAAGVPARAQSTVRQFWSELDLFWTPTSTIRVFNMNAQQYQSRLNDRILVGLHLDYIGMTNGFVRAGYRYLFFVTDAGRGEHRELVELTLHSGGTVRFVNRSRVEWRDIHGQYSMRVRERARLERAYQTATKIGLLPYASAELFYDSRFHALSRVRNYLGCEIDPPGLLTVDAAYVYQRDWRGGGPTIDAFQLKLGLHF